MSDPKQKQPAKNMNTNPQTSADSQPKDQSAEDVQQDQPVAAPTPSLNDKPSVPNPKEDFDGYVDWVATYGNPVQQEVVRFMQEYEKEMAPGRIISEDIGAHWQFRLLKLLETVLENSDNDQFASAWRTVLAYYQEHSEGMFGIQYVNRFPHAWKQSLNLHKKLLVLNNLILLTCDPKTRSLGLKQVDLESTLKHDFNELSRQRLISFYS